MWVYLILIAFQVWAVIDCLRHRPGSLWILVVLLFGPIGALTYVISELLSGRRFGAPVEALPQPRDERIDELEALIQSNPAPALFVELADLHARRHDAAAAADAYGRALETDEGNLYARYHLGRALAERGRYAEAADQLARVHAADAKYDYGAAAEALADALLAAGHDDAAFERYAEIAGSSSRSRPKFQYAQLLDRRGRQAEAAEMMREIVDQEDAIPAYLRPAELPWIEKARLYLQGLDTTGAEQQARLRT